MKNERAPRTLEDELRLLLTVLEYNPEIGTFVWRLNRRGHAKAGDKAGNVHPLHGYRYITALGKTYRAARLAWLMHYGQQPAHVIDHINGNRDDDRISNLRDVPQSINLQNRRAARSDSRSQLIGAHPFNHHGKKNWRARIQVGGKSKTIGYFATAQEAHEAYVAAKRSLHPGGML